MARNIQNQGKIDLDMHLVQENDLEDLVAQVDTLRVVSCPICQATYIPASQRQAETQSSLALLETAFLEVCHFCFRCQRPACPQCWNPVHNVCASCGEEARLPFRSPIPSLQGLVFSSPASPQTIMMPRIAFTCLCNGHFYTPEPVLSPVSPQTDPVALTSHTDAMSSLPVTVTDADTRLATYPSWLQEVMGYQPVQPMPDVCVQETYHLLREPGERATLFVQVEDGVDLSQSGQQAWIQEARTSRQLSDLSAPKDLEEQDWQMPLVDRIENALILITSTILIGIVVMIVLALSSASLNDLFSRLFHVDFRAEIAYLSQLVSH